MAQDTKADDKKQSTKPKAEPEKPVVFTPKETEPKTEPVATKVTVNRPVYSAPAKPQPNLPKKYQGCKRVVAKDGDTLYSIANDNNIALQQLRYFNGMRKGSKVKQGQVLYIPNKPVFVPVGR